MTANSQLPFPVTRCPVSRSVPPPVLPDRKGHATWGWLSKVRGVKKRIGFLETHRILDAPFSTGGLPTMPHSAPPSPAREHLYQSLGL